MSEQDIQFGSINFVRTAFSDMIMPVVRLEGPTAAANFFNVTFSRIVPNPVPEELDDSVLVADPLPTNLLFADSQAANVLETPTKESETAGVGLFVTDMDTAYKRLQQARPAVFARVWSEVALRRRQERLPMCRPLWTHR